ncbi:evolved beta-D-galactosidase beta subunit EbgC [[Pasteurella] aerogenes]|nr:evolved beta-D-galactosidase beta subunit EbgC [[Pasteurella] aerogenes]
MIIGDLAHNDFSQGLPVVIADVYHYLNTLILRN